MPNFFGSKRVPRCKIFLDDKISSPTKIVQGFICINVAAPVAFEFGNPFALIDDNSGAISFRFLTVRIKCVEHYTYETTHSSTDSDGNTTTTTETHHVYHDHWVKDVNPFFVKDTLTLPLDSSHLTIGLHHLRFACQLPKDALCTFNHSCDVSYTIDLFSTLNENKKWKHCADAFEVIPLPIEEAEMVLAGKPLPAARNKNNFMFSSGGVELQVTSPLHVFQLEAPFPLKVDLQNKSSKKVHRLTVSLMQLTSHHNGHQSTKNTVNGVKQQVVGHRNGLRFSQQINLAVDISPGKNFSFDGMITLPLHEIARYKAVTSIGDYVWAVFVVQVRAHVSWALDIVSNLPVHVTPEAPPPHLTNGVFETFDSTAARHKAEKHAKNHYMARMNDNKVSSSDDNVTKNEKVVNFDAKALDEDDFDLIEHDDNDKIDQNSITPDTPTPEGDDVDDDLRRFAKIFSETKPNLRCDVPLPAIRCPENRFNARCQNQMWGMLVVVVRGAINLPSKNRVNNSSDPYISSNIIDFISGHKTDYRAKTVVKKRDCAPVYNEVYLMSGGVAFNQHLRFTVKNENTFGDRHFGDVLLPWSTIACLTPLSDMELRENVFRLTQSDLPRVPSTSEIPAGFDETLAHLQGDGAWLTLRGDSGSEKSGARVCVALRRVNEFSLDVVQLPKIAPVVLTNMAVNQSANIDISEQWLTS